MAVGATAGGDLRFSLVVPMFDEQDNVVPLLEEVASVLGASGGYEVLLVDDGSTDETVARAQRYKRDNGAEWLRILRMAANGGQSAAVLAGVEASRAPLVAAMDGDLQNDPRDLLPMLELVESGRHDGVTGLRAVRRDSFVRRASSRVGNAVRNWLTGDSVRDAACGIKVFRRELFLSLPRFNGMHRFMATLARQAGADVVEVPVHHRHRQAGQAKYGIGNRALRGLADCLAVRWYRSRQLRYAVRDEV